jgi:molybdenum ABC transporter molybdate-binding protein
MLGFLYLRWRQVGRDPIAGPKFPRYEAPKGMSAAAVRFVDRQAFDDKCFAAALLGLASRGYMKIQQGGVGFVLAPTGKSVEYKGMDVLLDPSVKKIAIANPQHAPYGRAAVAALKHAGVYDRIVDRLVMGESVSQAAQFAESGNAQAGFVALAHAVAPGMRGQGKYWQVPADFYPPLTQGAVVLSHSQHKKEAKDFLEFIKTKEAGDVLQKYGFTLSS